MEPMTIVLGPAAYEAWADPTGQMRFGFARDAMEAWQALLDRAWGITWYIAKPKRRKQPKQRRQQKKANDNALRKRFASNRPPRAPRRTSGRHR
jgi:hypothetical protein